MLRFKIGELMKIRSDQAVTTGHATWEDIELHIGMTLYSLGNR